MTKINKGRKVAVSQNKYMSTQPAPVHDYTSARSSNLSTKSKASGRLLYRPKSTRGASGKTLSAFNNGKSGTSMTSLATATVSQFKKSSSMSGEVRGGMTEMIRRGKYKLNSTRATEARKVIFTDKSAQGMKMTNLLSQMRK